MWYSGGGFLNWKVGYATSEDGSYWTKYTNNPILDVGAPGDWDDGYVSVASVIYDSSDHLYKMWYNGNDGEGTTYIGYAESSPYVDIPDTAFLSALVDEGVDTNGDGLISYEEAEEVISLNFDGENYILCDGGFKDMTGIEAFINLDTLNASNQRFTNINVSKNTALKYLDLGGGTCNNPLASLDLTHNKALEVLICTGRQMDALDISNNTSLRYLDCAGNNLTELDLSKHIGLEVLICAENDLTSLNLSNNTALKELHIGYRFGWPNDFYGCPLTDLNISNCSELTHLDVRECGFSSLDLSNNTALTNLVCSGNDLTTLDLSNNIALTELNCGENILATLDLSNNTALKDIDIYLNEYLEEVCVWTMPFPPSNVSVQDYGCPNLFYTMECNDFLAPTITATDQLYQPEYIEATSSEDGVIYLVPENTDSHLGLICAICVDSVVVVSNTPANISLSGLDNGIYWLFARDSSGNLSEPATFAITGVGIEKGMAKNIRLYPNPTDNLLTIETKYPDHFSIEITTLNGQQILIGEMEGTLHQIDLSTFQKGIYFITIRSKDFVTTRKIVKL